MRSNIDFGKCYKKDNSEYKSNMVGNDENIYWRDVLAIEGICEKHFSEVKVKVQV